VNRLAPARNYWLGTTNPDGSPHAAPVWGVAVGDSFYIYSERSTAKARNLAREDRAVVHLESGDEVVIVHGHLVDVGPPRDHSAFVEAIEAKYNQPGDGQYLPSSDDSFDVLYLLRPTRALIWSLADYDGTQLRWVAPR
jgi:Pyridoxamine 5'-phosphate oxidase